MLAETNSWLNCRPYWCRSAVNNIMVASDETAINLYVSRKSDEIVRTAKAGLRLHNFSVQNNGTKVIITKGKLRIIWDLRNIIRLIAVHGSGNFDQRLVDPAYEKVKISIILRQQINVILIYLNDSDYETKVEQLVDLTKNTNLMIKIKRGQDDNLPKVGTN